ncbi:MAG: ABC transporter permease [Gemmatimonadota bacterium]|nr:MAG: ABC transporter permease [Gemmatimonadota bacterium]
MFHNYFKVALRNIRRNTKYSLINLTGLGMGIACSLFIFVYVQDEFSYDRFHNDIGTVYQVLSHTDVGNNAVTPVPLGPVLKDEFPEIEKMTRYHWMWGETVLSHGDKTFVENGIRLVDPSFFSIFAFPFLKGDPQTALDDIHSIVISEETARKYFAHGDPIGKILTMNHEHEFVVTGVIENIPHNSTLQFDMVIPIEFNITHFDSWYQDWNNLFVYTFIQCRKTSRVDVVNDKIAATVTRHGGQENLTLSVLPFADRHFFFFAEKQTVYAFLTIAVFILFIGCFNFMNLATARSTKRAAEIGMRKIVGAHRKQIVYQFLGESLLLTLMAGCIAVLIFIFLFPLFRNITGKEIDISYAFVLWCSSAVTLFTGFAAGSYPAFFLSNFKDLNVLRGNYASGSRGQCLRKTIVTVQFTLSILLMLGMCVVYQQTQYILNKDIGYNRDNIISIPMGGGSEKYFQTFKNELLKDPEILGVTGTAAALPFVNWRIHGFQWQGKDPDAKISISFNAVDYDFFETLQINIVDGGSFTKESFSENTFSLIVNEEMAKLMRLNSVIGASLTRGEQSGTVIGVVENFHFNPLRYHIEPLVLQLDPREIDNVLIRVQPENLSSTLSFIEDTWKEVIPHYPFQYSLLDEDYERNLFSLKRTGYLLAAFSILAIIISCLGLFGLSSHAAEQRTKEIGIRKVLGASIFSIVRYISKELVILVVIANLLVWPVAYYVMSTWLRNFAYRTSIEWWIFLLAGGSAVCIAILTVSVQSVKAAVANPVKSLRYE